MMGYYIFEIALTVALIVLISEVARRSSLVGAILASAPIIPPYLRRCQTEKYSCRRSYTRDVGRTEYPVDRGAKIIYGSTLPSTPNPIAVPHRSDRINRIQQVQESGLTRPDRIRCPAAVPGFLCFAGRPLLAAPG